PRDSAAHRAQHGREEVLAGRGAGDDLHGVDRSIRARLGAVRAPACAAQDVSAPRARVGASMIPTPSGTSVVRPRSLVLGGALLASAALLMNTFGRFAAPEEWLFFRYAACWAGTLAFVLACLSVGNRIVSALSLPGELQDARIALSFSTGVYVFFVSVFRVGFAGGVPPVGFVLVAVVLFALGARQLCRDLLAYRERARGSWLPRFSAAEAVGVAFGAIALAVIYLP